MPSATTANSNSALRQLPSVDALLRCDVGSEIVAAAGDAHAVLLARSVVERQRSEMKADDKRSRSDLLDAAEQMMKEHWQKEQMAGTQRVINATGVVIHTNLGRSPLSRAAIDAIVEAAGYCTLEYDLLSGKRGKRGARAEQLICELTGAEAALVVNNCAAAAFFVLTAFASGGETIVSRGELVEIGGDFRVPDILSQSGSKMREVGATNRTKLADYEKAITDQTKLILRVHPSNYRVIGFTATPMLADLASLAHSRGLMLYEDIGSGALTDVIADEPSIADSLASGVDIATFSGDKLLGGPQAGIVVGKANVIEQLRQHPLYRALRVDKITYAGLEATLDAYRRSKAAEGIPVQRMLAATKEEITQRAEAFVGKLAKTALKIDLTDGVSAVGGGAAPAVKLATTLIALSHPQMSSARIEHYLRASKPAVIARIVEDRVMIDLRTVSESDEEDLVAALNHLSMALFTADDADHADRTDQI